MRHIAATAAVSCAAAAGWARPTVIDFESFNLGGQMFLDVGPTLVFNTPGVTVTMNQGMDFRIYDLLLFGNNPQATGQALIDMSWSTFQNPNGTDILFDVPVKNFSLRAGDFGGDDDSPLKIEAFDAGGASLGVAMVSWPASTFPPFATLSLNVSGIRKVHYSSGGQFTGSTFIDDVTFEVVCYADCNQDGLLDVSDFGCFTNSFLVGAPYADCNGDGVLDIADFGCFTNAFIVGCP